MPYTLPNAKAEARRRMADTASPWAVFPLGADAYAVRPYSGARAYTDATAPPAAELVTLAQTDESHGLRIVGGGRNLRALVAEFTAPQS